MSTATWTEAVSQDWHTAGNWSAAVVPTSTSDVIIGLGGAIASTTIGTVHSITVSATLEFESAGATDKVTTFLTNSGFLAADPNSGEGGTSLTIGGLLTNSGTLAIGNTSLSSSDKIVAAALKNAGTIDLTGTSVAQALLDITGAAGFGTVGTVTGTVNLAGDTAIEFASGEINAIASGATLHLNGNKAFVEDSTALGKNSALTGLSNVSGAFFLDNKAAVSTGALANHGFIALDINGGEGGSVLTVGGVLTNTGTIDVGNSTLSSSDQVVAASLNNSGTINLTSNGANQALLDVTSAAPFALTGIVNLGGKSALEFTTGEINTIAAFASLTLGDSAAVVEDSTGPGKNSALTSLSNVNGSFFLQSQTSVSTTTSLVDKGFVFLDNGGAGGSSLSVAGTLTIGNTLDIGNSSLSSSDKVTAASLDNLGTINIAGAGFNQALLDVTAGAAGFGQVGILTGFVSLSGDSAVEFNTGEINTIATGATLDMNGNSAFVEDSKALGSNSALTGLSSVFGSFNLANQVAVSTTGSLTNTGFVTLDTFGSEGGSSLSIKGTLTNMGTLDIGGSFLTSSDKATAALLVNIGTINLTGFSTNQALLDVASGASFGVAGTVTGNVSLVGDSAIEFNNNGEISTIGLNATLSLNGNGAFVEDSAALGSNSALHGLSNVLGTLDLANQASLALAGALNDNGFVGIDSLFGAGASTVTITKGLTNSGTLDIGNGALSSSDSVKAAALTNTGAINLTGTTTQQALLDITGAAAGFGVAGSVTGAVNLVGGSAIEFKSGEIGSVALGATLSLNGNNAFVEDSTLQGSNSALTGLTSVVGTFELANQALVALGGALTVDALGLVTLDSPFGSGGSTLNLTHPMTNSGTLDIGNGGLSSSDKVAATAFTNSGVVNLTSNLSNDAALSVSGQTTNNGAFNITSDVEELAGAIVGTGQFNLFSGAKLQFDSSVGAGETVAFSGADDLALKSTTTFAGTIAGFGTGDTIDALSFALIGTTKKFVENGAGTGGTLTLTNGAQVAHILFSGVYTTASFSLSADAGGHALVSFV